MNRNEQRGSKSTCFTYEKCKLSRDVIQYENGLTLLSCLLTVLFKDKSEFVTFELDIFSAF